MPSARPVLRAVALALVAVLVVLLAAFSGAAPVPADRAQLAVATESRSTGAVQVQ